MLTQRRYVRRVVGLAVLVGLLAFGAEVAAMTSYLVRAELSTTSEWLELRVEGAEVRADWWAPDTYPHGLHVYTEPHVRIEKPCCLETPVTVEMDLLVVPTGEEEISWTITMGSYGRSQLAISAMPAGDADPVSLAKIMLRAREDGAQSTSGSTRTALSKITANAAPRDTVDPSSPTYAEAETHFDLEYAAVPGVKPALLSLDLMLPARDLANPPPLVVCIHGGGMVGGDKKGIETFGRAKTIVGETYAVASINYRLMPEARFPAQLHDVRGAVAWLKAHAGDYGYDGNRIGLWGFSAGGCLAFLAGLTEGVDELSGIVGDHAEAWDGVSAVCSYYGTADFRTMIGGTPWVYLGCEEGDTEFAAFASPVSHVTPDDPPVFLLHGERDQYLPVEQAEMLFDLLQDAGVPSELVIVGGAMHGGQTGWWGEGPRALRDFLDLHVLGDAQS